MSRYIIFLFLLSLPAYAFRMTPMSLEIRPEGKDSKTRIFVENESKEKMAIKLFITKRIMDEKGNEERPAVGDLFQVFPEQLILNPSEKRAVNISWKGDKILKDELAFRIIGEQLPVDLAQTKDQQNSGIKILLKYVAALYVSPENTKSDVQIQKGEIDSKNKRLVLYVKNMGSRHEVLKGAKVIIVQGKKTIATLVKESLEGMINENVLAQGARSFSIPLPTEVTSKNINNYQYKLELENN